MEAVLCQLGLIRRNLWWLAETSPSGGGDSVVNSIGSSMLVLLFVDNQTAL